MVDQLNISYACDENYFQQTTISIESLLDNNRSFEKINIFFIDMGISEQSRANMIQQVEGKYNRRLIFIPFNEIAYDLEINHTGRHIASVYAKLFFGRLDIDKILYIDSDTIILDDLHSIWETNIEDYYCAGVETIHTKKENERMGLASTDKVINDGVLLMNLTKWRNDNCLDKCLKYIKDNDGTPPVLSEGTINHICVGKILIIHPRYNLLSGIVNIKAKRIVRITKRDYYTQKELDDAFYNPCIIHFLSGFFNRPWFLDCTHPLKCYYDKYKAMTIWKNEAYIERRLSFRTRAVGWCYYHFPVWLFVLLRKIFGDNQ